MPCQASQLETANLKLLGLGRQTNLAKVRNLVGHMISDNSHCDIVSGARHGWILIDLQGQCAWGSCAGTCRNCFQCYLLTCTILMLCTPAVTVSSVPSCVKTVFCLLRSKGTRLGPVICKGVTEPDVGESDKACCDGQCSASPQKVRQPHRQLEACCFHHREVQSGCDVQCVLSQNQPQAEHSRLQKVKAPC